ncbi:hypothetical protein [Robertmurraya sp.]|uniref:hypothetical protein n=1 Tax=Robertmurraya sp. TaxID=2837525 RepID=UPI0037048C35
MIQEYENILRSIISNVLGTNDDTVFKISSERIEKWKEKREEEKKKFDGILTEARIIFYSDFYDLGNIISKNWGSFKSIFNDKKRFDVLFSEMETFRNTISHGRQLLPYQEQIVKGIIGDLKTKLVTYHNRNMGADDYFIKILKVSDSLGSIWDNTMLPIGLFTKKTLRVGDSIEILIEAYDPKGREITYRVRWGNIDQKGLINNFTIVINKSMIGKTSNLRIEVSTKETDYENSDTTYLRYIVLP